MICSVSKKDDFFKRGVASFSFLFTVSLTQSPLLPSFGQMGGTSLWAAELLQRIVFSSRITIILYIYGLASWEALKIPKCLTFLTQTEEHAKWRNICKDADSGGWFWQLKVIFPVTHSSLPVHSILQMQSLLTVHMNLGLSSTNFLYFFLLSFFLFLALHISLRSFYFTLCPSPPSHSSSSVLYQRDKQENKAVGWLEQAQLPPASSTLTAQHVLANSQHS